jgi:HEPN domain-containing protein
MDEAVKMAVERWLAKAANDLRTAETVISIVPPVVDTACYHAQQCVEKCLKAFLTLMNRHVERTHNLPRLVEQCAEFSLEFTQLADIGVELTDYAVQSRYPDDWRDIPLEEARCAVEKAREAMEFVKAEIERREESL